MLTTAYRRWRDAHHFSPEDRPNRRSREKVIEIRRDRSGIQVEGGANRYFRKQAEVTERKRSPRADTEEAQYALQKENPTCALPYLMFGKNPILPSITARQNDLALQAAEIAPRNWPRISRIEGLPIRPRSMSRRQLWLRLRFRSPRLRRISIH